jgi:hypothetical protein
MNGIAVDVTQVWRHVEFHHAQQLGEGFSHCTTTFSPEGGKAGTGAAAVLEAGDSMPPTVAVTWKQ